MTTTTVFSDASDGYIYSDDAVYATAAAGTGVITADTTSTIIFAGQIPGIDEVLQGYIAFDTSPIPDSDSVSAAVLSLYGEGDNSTQDFTLEARLWDWGTTLTTADWRTPAQLGSATFLASFATAGFSVAAYNDFTSQAGMPAAINKTGFTRMVLASDRNRTSTPPAGGVAEYVSMWCNEDGGSGTTRDPKLVITHTVGSVNATATPAAVATVLTTPASTRSAGSTPTPSQVVTFMAQPSPAASASNGSAPNRVITTMAAPTPITSTAAVPQPARVTMVLTTPAVTLTAGSKATPAVTIMVLAAPSPAAGGHSTASPAAVVTSMTAPTPTYRADAFRVPATVTMVLTTPAPSIQSTSTISVNLATFDIVCSITAPTVPPFRVINLPTFDILTVINGPEAVLSSNNTFNIISTQTPATVEAIVIPNQVTIAVTLPTFNILTNFFTMSLATQVALPTHAAPLPNIYYTGATPPEIIQAASLGAVTRVTSRLEVQNPDGSIYLGDLDLESGSITLSVDRNERRTIDLSIHDPDNRIDHHPGGLWYDKVVVPYRGITFQNHVWEAPLGRFYIDKISEPDFPHVVSITGRDQTKQLLNDKLAFATHFAPGEAPEDVIRVIAINGGITRLNLEVTGKTLGRDYTFERNTSRWDIISSLAEAFSMEAFFDSNGYLVLRTFRDPTLTPSIWTFQTGANVGNLATFTKSGDDSRLFNHIVVVGQSTAQLPVTAEVENQLAGSGSNIDLIGRRTYPFESNFVSTQAQADDLAATLLQVMSLESYEMNFDALVASWLEVGEVVDIVDPEPWTAQPLRFLLTDLRIPLGLGSMSGTGKRVMIVGAVSTTPPPLPDPTPNPTPDPTPTPGAPPIPSFTGPTNSIAGNSVQFVNTTTGGVPTSSVWNFGDGSATFSGYNPPAHTYTTAGNYTVTLTESNAGNTPVSTTRTLAVSASTVNPPPPPPPPSGTVRNVPAQGSLQQVVDSAQPGDTIYVTGTVEYDGNALTMVNRDNGTNPIKVIGNAGNIIRSHNSGVEAFGSCRGWLFQDLNFEVDGNSYGASGVSFYGMRNDYGADGAGCENIRLINLHIRPISGTGTVQRDAITVWGCDNVEVAYCDIDHAGFNDLGFFGGAGSGISLGETIRSTRPNINANGKRVWVHHNKVRHIVGPGTAAADRNGIILDLYMDRADHLIGTTLIEYNDIADCEGRGISANWTSDVEIRNNLVRPPMATNLGGSLPGGIVIAAFGQYSNFVLTNNDVQVSPGFDAYLFYGVVSNLTGSGNIGSPIAFQDGIGPPPGF